jgi:hypothetical protein
MECIGKGKASAPYKFGVKASIVTTNARAPGGQFVLHARTPPGNPYDGQTWAIDFAREPMCIAIFFRFGIPDLGGS